MHQAQAKAAFERAYGDQPQVRDFLSRLSILLDDYLSQRGNPGPSISVDSSRKDGGHCFVPSLNNVQSSVDTQPTLSAHTRPARPADTQPNLQKNDVHRVQGLKTRPPRGNSYHHTNALTQTSTDPTEELIPDLANRIRRKRKATRPRNRVVSSDGYLSSRALFGRRSCVSRSSDSLGLGENDLALSTCIAEHINTGVATSSVVDALLETPEVQKLMCDWKQ